MILQSSLTGNAAGIDHNLLLPLPLLVAFALIFGGLIGSFLNVVIYRLPRGIFFESTFSRCPSCGEPIKFYDNIPVLSYLLLGGRCRQCRASISARYPAVEALTAMLFALTTYVVLTRGTWLSLPFDLIFVAAILALIFIDAELMILPNKITYPGFFIAVLVRLIVPNMYGVAWLDLPVEPGYTLSTETGSHAFYWLAAFSFINSLAGALVGGGSLWLVGWIWKRLRGVDAMGLGDVKMMFMVGAYLGWTLTLVTIFIGFLSGAVGGVLFMYKSGKRDLSMQLPFGIFLGIGAIISLLFGTDLVNWYLGQFR
ncbi:MAG: prepilin peptidase [Pyrinomonadaceae bacterium MAG19_C2-C3]|nr:prepilin peptidase [Pyrinomonadaceae bacterium MAG19_C2-C3]